VELMGGWVRPLSNEINAIFVYEVICRVCESQSVSFARAISS
jgi:hypothetical protein